MKTIVQFGFQRSYGSNDPESTKKKVTRDVARLRILYKSHDAHNIV